MKNSLKSAEAKQIRLSINNQKCEIALNKGYKYDKSTGEIIGVRGKVINAKINGYTVISFVDAGVKHFLYATTFIEYVLKTENGTVSKEELELAKVFVKPSIAYLANRKTLQQAKELNNESNCVEVTTDQLKHNPPMKDYLTKDKTLNHRTREFFKRSFQFRTNRSVELV